MLKELDSLTTEVEQQYNRLEERWICGHHRAQALIDSLRISPIVPLDGLYAYLTEGADCLFEKSVVQLYADADERTKEIEVKYHYSP